MLRRCALLALPLVFSQLSSTMSAQTPTAEQALKLTPMQQNVDYDIPAKEDAAQCRIAPEETKQATAWVVRSAAGELLRRFVDSNKDNKVDQWRYFKSGIEVYRDVDADFNGKADQYRWLGTAGTRWGLDQDEDGVIDAWKTISPEEVTAEIVGAIKSKDQQRFENVLLRTSEVSSLGLGKQLDATIAARVAGAMKEFNRVANNQSQITADTQWIDFGGLRPGTIPAGTDGSTQDVTVYENVVAMIETDGKPTQLPIGTLVKVGEGWRVVDLAMAKDNAANQFVFFEAASQPNLDETGVVSEETQRLVDQLDQLDKRLSATTAPQELFQLNRQRADILEQLAERAVRDADREMWLMQFADMVGAAAQSGAYADGTTRLASLLKKLQGDATTKDELLAHVTFAHMSAEYALQLQDEDVDFGKVQQQWLAKLEGFVKDFPKTRDAPEAMLQLALAKEFAGADEEANRWYTKLVEDFSDSPLASKAAGAKRRLESVGKSIPLTGTTIDGKRFDLARLRGKVVLLHYWASWCEPCKQDMEVLAELRKELGNKLEIVGVNLDSETSSLSRYFAKNRPQWTHLYEKGGLDSRLANEMGVFTLPVMLLIDERGNVVNRQIHGPQLKSEIGKLLR